MWIEEKVKRMLIDSEDMVIVLLVQTGLYPTVGLQTPGEVVEANFGNSPFVFDFEDYVKVLFSCSAFD